jgi:hypothetical protein
MKPGTRVLVRSSFDGSWASGFVLESEERDETGKIIGRRVRRLSDGMVLPKLFPPEDVRREKRDDFPWWMQR